MKDSKQRHYKHWSIHTKNDGNFFINIKDCIANVYKERTARGQKILIASYDTNTKEWTETNEKMGGKLPYCVKTNVEELCA